VVLAPGDLAEESEMIGIKPARPFPEHSWVWIVDAKTFVG